MINLEYAKNSFQQYLSQFDAGNEKIMLKIVHTEGVVRAARAITARMDISEEDRALAELIALLHDIGRFEQIRQFDSFEPGVMDHALYGVQYLFGENKKIREYVLEDTWDDIIYTAIAKHSDYAITGIADERTLFHAKMIRDADKLDNCRVKLEEKIEVLLDTSKEDVGSQEISEKVWQSCLNRKCVLSADRRTKMDYWVSYLAFFYDIYFPQTAAIILENDYIPEIKERIPYSNLNTAEKMGYLERDIVQTLQRMQ